MDHISNIKHLIKSYQEAEGLTKKILLGNIINLIAKELEPEAKEIVKITESKIETTRGHYGEYLNILTNLKGIYRLAMKKALENAGASLEGIDGTMMILNQ